MKIKYLIDKYIDLKGLAEELVKNKNNKRLKNDKIKIGKFDVHTSVALIGLIKEEFGARLKLETLLENIDENKINENDKCKSPYWLQDKSDENKTEYQLVKDYYDLIKGIVETWSFDHGRTVTVRFNKSDVKKAKRELENYMKKKKE